jgi:hypothetical protein
MLQRSLCLALAGLCVGRVSSAADTPATVELLKEPDFHNGVRVAGRSNCFPEIRDEARARWERVLPATTTSSWEFIEIAELQDFSDNPDTPEVDGPRITYASRDRSKRFEVDRETGEVRYVIDTEREWRNGCNLSGLQDGAEPRFCRGKDWNWPHFLLSQAIRDPLQPDQPLRLDAHQRLTFKCTAELVFSEMGQPNPCPAGTWGPEEVGNHCLFYVDFVMVHRNPEAVQAAGGRAARLIFALYPVFCSWDGKTHSSPAPWLGLDPADQAVYWTPNLTGLEPGKPVEVSIDAGSLAREAVASLNERYQMHLSPDDYTINEMLMGWEIWGPFRCDIRLRDLSFTATAEAPPTEAGAAD